MPAVFFPTPRELELNSYCSPVTFFSFANFLFCNHEVHLPSLTAFSNWPTSSTPLGHVTAIDFAARSEYVAIGNTRGRVLLYHLKDYGASSIAGY